MTATTWNPSDKSASVTLSNGNLTATTTSTNQGVRSNNSKSSGKWYAEFKNCFFSTAPSSGTRGGIGLADSTYVLTAGFGSGNSHLSLMNEVPSVFSNGTTTSDGALTTPIGTSVVIGVAVDVGNKLVWFTENGSTWNNGGTANPATGVGGYSLGSMGPDIFLVSWLRWNGGSPNDNATMNVGASAYSYSIPSGFSSWDVQEASSSEQASSSNELLSDMLLAEQISSDHLLAEQISSDTLEYQGWNPNDRSSFDLEITDHDHTAINAGSAGEVIGVRGNTSHSAGKYYVEFKANHIDDVGIEGPSRSIGFYPSSGDLVSTDLTKFAGLNWQGAIDGAVMAVVIDFDNHVWGFQELAFTEGFTFQNFQPNAIGVPLFPYFRSVASGDSITVNLGTSPFSGAMPEGFVAWDSLQEAASGAEQPYPFWNENDKNSGITLSNLDQTFTISGINQNVRSVRAHETGKFYAVFHAISFATGMGSDSAIGLADSSRSLSAGKNDPGAAWLNNSGFIRNDGGDSIGFSSSISNLSGHDVEMAVNLETGKLWFRLDGAGYWNNSVTDNPATGGGGSSLRDGGWDWTSLYVLGFGENSGDTATVLLDGNIEPSSLAAYSPPAGFAWWNDESASSEFASEQASSLEAFSSDHLASEQASSDRLLAEAVSSDRVASDRLLAEEASSDHQASERASSDHQASERASSDLLLAEQHSSDHLLFEQASSSDYLLHEQQSSDDAPGEQASSSAHEQASSERQSDLTNEIPPPIQVVAIVS